jgi:hypothetical protein
VLCSRAAPGASIPGVARIRLSNAAASIKLLAATPGKTQPWCRPTTGRLGRGAGPRGGPRRAGENWGHRDPGCERRPESVRASEKGQRSPSTAALESAGRKPASEYTGQQATSSDRREYSQPSGWRQTARVGLVPCKKTGRTVDRRPERVSQAEPLFSLSRSERPVYPGSPGDSRSSTVSVRAHQPRLPGRTRQAGVSVRAADAAYFLEWIDGLAGAVQERNRIPRRHKSYVQAQLDAARAVDRKLAETKSRPAG